jgi:hypothetical protein
MLDVRRVPVPGGVRHVEPEHERVAMEGAPARPRQGFGPRKRARPDAIKRAMYLHPFRGNSGRAADEQRASEHDCRWGRRPGGRGEQDRLSAPHLPLPLAGEGRGMGVGVGGRSGDDQAEYGGDNEAHDRKNRFKHGPAIEGLLHWNAKVTGDDPESAVIHVRGYDRARRD